MLYSRAYQEEQQQGGDDDSLQVSTSSVSPAHARTKGLTKKLPRAELKMAPASFPPTALVRMTAEETGGGIHPTTCNL